MKARSSQAKTKFGTKSGQKSFFSMKETSSFGGELLKKAANRHARPISAKDPMHVVLRSTKAKGLFSFGHHSNVVQVKQVIDRHCAKYGVKLIKFSNNYNHLHLFLKFPSRETYLRFIRSLTGQLAMVISHTKKLASLKSIFGADGFFDYRPFTRVVRGLKAYKVVCDYIRLNQLEAEGLIPKRDGRLRDVTAEEAQLFNRRTDDVGSRNSERRPEPNSTTLFDWSVIGS